MRTGLLCLLVGATTALASASAGPVRLEAQLLPRKTTKPLTVGDRFKVELTVRRHRDQRLSPPVLDDERFLVLDAGTVSRYEGDTIVDVHTLEVAAFATGDLHLPGFTVSFPDGDTVRTARSDSLPLKVASVMAKEMADINDLKPQVAFPNLLPLWLALGALAAAALALIGARFLRRWRRRRRAGAPLPEPWEEALVALGALPVSDWLAAGQVKRYYYAVSEILKRYLTRRFGFPAVDQTTSEMMLAMKAARVAERDEIARFFRRADFVKYAKLVPERPELEAAIVTARELVEKTRPTPEDGNADGRRRDDPDAEAGRSRR
ncbi:MAG TPA: hypothetical protein ENN51_01615 [candidate division WOR-3 bacterium]|mgnify:CR=1 FL=1|uniref:Protein BatD n=1 Tax=candidate division WOR-3 bacterium TaxID=2052148 RepID=A0A7V0XEP1_UNCW3|nr:hypothetical protein [candidate division WOR-3 bacterium]